MNIVFEKIKIHNFMSIQDAEIILKDRGTILIKGVNNEDPLTKSNGSGKSILTCESILWCLTGETNKDTKQINPLYIKNGIADVTLDLNIDNDKYQIQRINDTTKTLIIKKNGIDISGNTLTKSKEILNKELGFINKEILTSIIILGQGLEGKFSDLKPSERKARLEYLVGMDSLLDNIGIMIDKTEETINKSLTDIKLKITEQNTIIDTSQNIINSYNDRPIITDEEYKENKEKLNECANKGNQLSQEVDIKKQEVNKELENKNKISEQLLDLNKQISLKQKEIDNYNNQTNFIKSKLEDIQKQLQIAQNQECPLCHQHLEDNTLKEHLNQEIENNNKELEKLNKEINIQELTNQINNLKKDEIVLNQNNNNSQSKINDLNSQINNINSQLNEIVIEYNKYKEFFDRYDKYKAESQSIDKVIADANSRIEEANKILEDLNNQQTKLNKDKELNKFFKNQVSRKFRNFLLEGVFNYINERLEYYSSKLFTNYKIKLENKGNDINIWLSEKEFSSLSGGEKQKTNLAVQFALRDLARNQRGWSCNLIELDEVFDGLDDLGIEIMVKFIETELQDINSMFIITHMKDLKIDYDGIIEVTKGKDKISVVKEL